MLETMIITTSISLNCLVHLAPLVMEVEVVAMEVVAMEVVAVEEETEVAEAVGGVDEELKGVGVATEWRDREGVAATNIYCKLTVSQGMVGCTRGGH